MGGDKAKDDKEFNCSQGYEHSYVANLYSLLANRLKVLEFLAKKWKDCSIINFDHTQVYELIKQELGYLVPVIAK